MTPKIQNLEIARGDSLSVDLNLGGLTEESIMIIDFSAKKRSQIQSIFYRKVLNATLKRSVKIRFAWRERMVSVR